MAENEHVLDQIARYLGEEQAEKITNHDLPFSIAGIDLKKPPGFTGKVVEWINHGAHYPRRNLAVIAALTAIGNIAGLKYRDDISGITTNLLSICIAGTGTGKDWIIAAMKEIISSSGMGAACCGDMKSKQEVIRNLIEHQAAFYIKDEIGEIMRSIENAKKSGNAAYLEGITGEIMSIFTKANTSLQVGGDIKRDMIKAMQIQMASIAKIMEEQGDESGRYRSRMDSMMPLYESISRDGSLPKPFLSLLGCTTMEAFEGSINVEVVKNGLLNRTIIVEENDTNPKYNTQCQRTPFPYDYELLNIGGSGVFPSASDRIENYEEPQKISTNIEAKKMLLMIMDWQWEYAEYHKEHTGYESLARRAYEFISKVSTILAIGDGAVRTSEHIKWAAAYIKRDIENKIGLAIYATGKQAGAQKEEVMDSLEARAVHLCGKKGVYRSTLVHKLKRKGLDTAKIESFIDRLVNKEVLVHDGKFVKNKQ